MLRIGCHLSPAKGLEAMGGDALSIGANTFQFFLRNPRGSRAREIKEQEAAKFSAFLAAQGMSPLVVHAPYTLNPCAKEERVQEFAALVLTEDLMRMALFPGHFYNLHPGSHVGQGVEAAIGKTAALLNRLLSPQTQATVLLETMAGQGSEIGGRFEQIGAILARLEQGDKAGVCMDTCHVFAAGYDIVHDLDGVLAEFDTHIGLGKLKALHINDSLFPLSSRRDRHAPIGKGAIGGEALRHLAHHPALRHLPMILETPQESLEGYAREIRFLRGEAVDNL